MADLSANLTGTLTVQPALVDEAKGSTGCNFGLSILDDHKAAPEEISQQNRQVNSPSSLQALGVPANIQGRVLYIRAKSNAVFNVQLTKAVTGVELLTNQRGMLLLEFDAVDFVSAVSIQGEVTIEWALFGKRV